MRTTVDIDKDVLNGLRGLSEKEDIPFKHLVNRLLREALNRPFVRQPPYKGPSFPMGPFLVPPEKALDYLDEQADREFVERMYRKKGERP